MSDEKTKKIMGFFLNKVPVDNFKVKDKVLMAKSVIFQAGIETSCPNVVACDMATKEKVNNSGNAQLHKDNKHDQFIEYVENNIKNANDDVKEIDPTLCRSMYNAKELRKYVFSSKNSSPETKWKEFEKIRRVLRNTYLPVWDIIFKKQLPSGQQLEEKLELFRQSICLLEMNKNKNEPAKIVIGRLEEDNDRPPSFGLIAVPPSTPSGDSSSEEETPPPADENNESTTGITCETQPSQFENVVSTAQATTSQHTTIYIILYLIT
jgi:hypothetical protein